MKPDLQLLRDILLACRWAYYVKGVSIVTDYEYDVLEREYLEEPGAVPLPVGSSNPEDYAPGVRALGLYFLLGGEPRKSPLVRPRRAKISSPESML